VAVDIRRSRDLGVVAFVACVAMIVSLVGLDNVALRTILAVPLVFVCPGYALTSALFPQRMPGPAEKLVALLGLSLACTALGGILLNLTPWGLQTDSWALLLAAVTLIACVAAQWRRRGEDASAPGPLSLHVTIGEGFLCGLAVLVAGSAVGVAQNGALHQPIAGFTQLWLVPARRGNSHAVEIGIRSMEHRATTYTLQITIGNRVIAQRPSLTLRPGQTWQDAVVLPRTRAPRIDGLLYRADAPHSLYRRVTLWHS
jgi:uncharacterized membrane protein